MMTKITPDQARALAALTASLRADLANASDWDSAGIYAAIRDSVDRGDAWEICHAVLAAAAEPSNRTPAVIALTGAHWTAAKGTPSAGRKPGVSADDMPGMTRCPEHPWERASNCRACRSEALEAPEPYAARVAALRTQHVPSDRIRELLDQARPAPEPDVRQLAAGDTP